MLPLFLILCVGSTLAQTPVIGGNCKLGTADVQIGGKQTQFFLKCEATADSTDGEGVWVVKSRAANAAAPTENVAPQQHPKARKPATPNICEQDNAARENEACAVSATCLQAHNEYPSSYLQCDQSSQRWTKKSCQEGFLFNFEQQTCIVPKRMNSLSRTIRGITNTTDCQSCPIGTACNDQNVCIPLTQSKLCADSTSPISTCNVKLANCPKGFFCTAQGVCCSQSALQATQPCLLFCTISESCPQGMICNNNCCEDRKIFRHPELKGYDNEAVVFAASNDIFDSAAIESYSTFLPLQVEEEEVTRSPPSPSPPPPCKQDPFMLPCGGTNAVCYSSDDCPVSFNCFDGCCRLAVCPRSREPVKYTCNQPYQCGAGERCVLGACCPNLIKPPVHMAVDNAVNGYDLGVEAAPTTIRAKTMTPRSTTRMTTTMRSTTTLQPTTVRSTTTMMPTTMRSTTTSLKPDFDDCQIDDRVSDCSFDNPCPEGSDCILGVCCRSPTSSCRNGLPALTIPEFCRKSEECPLSSKCDHGRCCPFASENEGSGNTLESNSVEDILVHPGQKILKSTVKDEFVLKKEPLVRTITSSFGRSSGRSTAKNCIVDQKCDMKTLCPPSYTCSLSGICCKLNEKCPDGTIPESSCDDRAICPSASHGCLILSKSVRACCPVVKGQQSNGLLCTYSSCSNSNPCSSGTCNNGYCCSSSGGSSAIIPPNQHLLTPKDDFPIGPPGFGFPEHLADLDQVLIKATGDGFQNSNSGGCPGCNQSPQIITLSNSCPGGGYSVGSCSTGYCATGYTCVSNQCCPSYSSPSISVYTCPGGGSAVGACISGGCATGYVCQNNACCPSSNSASNNPFVCPDGTQAAGGCVNGQCGAGYSCSNGLCCVGSSSTVRCLDGSEAVGACIPSCQGNACGGSTLTYYCGSGYTCTTGNICCAINSCPNGGDVLGPTVNGLCPTGYVAQGSVCCTAVCSDGTAGSPAVNGACPTGYTYTNGTCCASTTTSTVTCDDDISIGPCGSGYNSGCPVGYSCDSTATKCCPVVDYSSESCQVGPAIDGLCPPGYVVVYIPDSPLISDGVNPGTCIDVQCITGICSVSDQIGECDQNTDTGTCPTGYTCFTAGGVCCKSSTFFSRLRKAKLVPIAQKPVYGRPLHSYMPPRFGGAFGGQQFGVNGGSSGLSSVFCRDGSSPISACINDLCGVGLECQNGHCCQPGDKQQQLRSQCPSGDTAISGCFPDGTCGIGLECVQSVKLCCPPGQPVVQPQVTMNLGGNTFGGNNFGANNNNNNNQNVFSPRPIGARCMVDGECVGQSEGLSLCHAGVCQCSPIAYAQGIACVRKMSFQMNDQPIVDGEDKNAIVSV